MILNIGFESPFLLLFKFVLVLTAAIAVLLIMVMDIDDFATGAVMWECVCHESRDLTCRCSERVSANVRQAGIRAPMLAMVSAFMILLKLSPPRRSIAHRLLDSLIIPFSAVTGVLAGWHWLSAETSGEPGRYVLAVFVVATILVVAFFVGPFLDALRDSVRVFWCRIQPWSSRVSSRTIDSLDQMTTWSRQTIESARRMVRDQSGNITQWVSSRCRH